MARELNLYSFVLTKGYKAPRSMNVMAFRADLHAFIKGLELSTDERLAVNSSLGLYTDAQYKKLMDRLIKNDHIKG